MLIQIHMLQNYAPANLNRDDTGSPKDAMFGGFLRGRISSQCLKRSIRKSPALEEAFKAEGLLGIRTKRLPGLIEIELKALGVDAKTIQAIVERVPEIGKKAEKKAEGSEEDEPATEDNGATSKAETRQLIFIGANELRPLAERLLKLYKESKNWKKEELEKSLGNSSPRSVDIALFGRMTTSETFENVSASSQVAHAISTNALTQEFDYYTALDDISLQSGAGMIGDVEFNSSTYYKYLNVHWEELLKNLGGDVTVATQAILALVNAATTAQPSGKQNSFAAHNLPDLVLVEVSEKNLPISYANAFLRPARANNERTLTEASAAQLSDYMTRINKMYKPTGQRAFAALIECNLPGAQQQESLDDLQSWLATQLPKE